MRFTVGSLDSKEIIEASSKPDAFEKFLELHPEETNNAIFLVYEVPKEGSNG